ncbi:MAG: 16S rRNA (guanine(527)-N(7))-methyltransferase RsmG [Deltaproteobacteria bacterium]|nr:16S rRNA (guanine(527)-N(7))-methyltransferase RsmG [Deltaproteobacteria bacterium]TLN03855.1 MAG: 16S rRNA (guanine(527)-N(7))-methyltransferase RsmG [bacterium]
MNKESLELLRFCAGAFALELSAKELGLFDHFAEELKKWNRKINLTAIKDDQEIVIKHFVDSLSLLGCLKKNGKLLDIGSGGGFPAIPLKILLPELPLVSVDAVEKKILFQRHVARILQLQEFTALHARVEDLSKSHAAQFETIVSRAFADLPLFISLALPLLKPMGQIIAMKGKEGREEALAAKKSLAGLGAKIVDCIHLRLPSSGAERFLVVVEKTETK